MDADTVLFADDAAFFISASNLPSLYRKIKDLFDNLSRYLKRNKLVPNLGKSKLMMFSLRARGPLPNILFDEEIIEWVHDFKYLGLIITNNLCFGAHIDKICTQVSQFTGVFYNLNKFFPTNILMLLYNSFVLPHLILHIEIWGAAPNFYLNKLAIKQNKLLRAILGVEVIENIPVLPTIEMYRITKVLTIRNLFKYYIFKFLILMLRGYLPYFYDTLMRPLEVVHVYGTRNNNFRHPLIINEIVRRSLSSQVIQIYESIPSELLDDSIPKALRSYKNILLNSQ